MRVPSALLAAALAAVALAGAACQSKADRTGLASRGFASPDFDSLWEIAGAELQRSGFTPDLENSSKETKTLVSRWSLSMSPFSHKGYREQATLYFHEVEGSTHRWTIEANVIREVNSNLSQPNNPVAAKWETGVRVPEKERAIVGRIEMFFLPRDVSPEFRARYGMPRAPSEEPPKPGTGEPTPDTTRPR